MEELPRAKSSRRGYRAHIMKTYGRIQEIIEATAESTEPSSDRFTIDGTQSAPTETDSAKGT